MGREPSDARARAARGGGEVCGWAGWRRAAWNPGREFRLLGIRFSPLKPLDDLAAVNGIVNGAIEIDVVFGHRPHLYTNLAAHEELAQRADHVN